MRRILFSFAALVVFGSLAAACGDEDATPKLTPVSVVLDWTPNTNHGGLYLAQQQGLYKKAGLDVTIIEPGANGGLPMLVAGEANFAVSAAESLLAARVEGADVVSVGAILAHNTSSLVIPADRGVRSAKDLQGKTYGGYGSELEKALVDELVRCDGGDPAKVNYVEVGNVDYEVGFAQNHYDAVWVFDGWDVIRMRDLDGLAITTIPFLGSTGKPACIPDWYTPLLAASGTMLKEQPELVKSFLQATAAGYEKARTDPKAAAAALLGTVPELDRELVERSAVYLATRFGHETKAWGVQDPVIWNQFGAFLKERKLLPADIKLDAAFTNDFLPRS